ncbi:lysophospholipid acyltransferase family protein [Deltaproteobacteria bacterium TL4]
MNLSRIFKKELLFQALKSLKTWILIRILVLFIWLNGLTNKVKRLNEEVIIGIEKEHKNYILALWHENIFFCTWLLRNRKLLALVSKSKDGANIYEVMSFFGYEAVRGSSSRGGAQALLQISRALKGNQSAAITPDGPRGPRLKVQPGIVMLAKMTGLPIIPWHYEAQRQWVVSSWDQHRIIKPFSKVVSAYGEPFYVPKNISSEDLPRYCEQLEQKMLEHTHYVQQQMKQWNSLQDQ